MSVASGEIILLTRTACARRRAARGRAEARSRENSRTALEKRNVEKRGNGDNCRRGGEISAWFRLSINIRRYDRAAARNSV